MAKKLRVLVVEDSEDDASLVMRELHRGGYEPISERVETQEAMKAALVEKVWDVVISDYSMPRFTPTEALALLKEMGLDLPFIVVSGTITEEIAVAAMKAGAHDYVMKSNLTRLGPAIERELRDARERKVKRAAQEALRQSEERFFRMAENLPDLIYRYRLSPKRGFEYVSPAATSVTGYTPQEHYADPDLRIKIVHPEDRPLLEAYFRGQGRWRDPIVLRWLRKDGTVIWTEQRNAPVYDEHGNLVAIEGVARDVTQRVQASEALRSSEELYRSLVEAGSAVIRSTRDGRHTFANHQATALFGKPLEQLLAGSVRDMILPEDRGKVESAFQEVFERGRPVRGLVLQHRVNGEVTHISTNWEPVRDAQGNVVEVQTTAFDISDQRRLEEQYQQAQKMESVGRLAGGIAHDFNNLLTVILGYAEVGAEALPEDSPVRGHLQEIKAAGERAASLTRQLLAFSRRQIIDPQVMSLNELVANMGKMLQRLIGEDVQLVTLTTSDLWSVKVDPGQMEQVLANLAVNSRDAMPRGGKLTIETANVKLDESYARTHTEVTPGDYVLLSVSDTGSGMTEDVKAHLFEPFFTTKKVGEGTGLGLATCYGIVKQVGGHIWVYSEPGQGTAIKVYLPRVQGETEALRKPEPAQVLQGTETVLVVEDEAAVRAVAVTVLRSQGYTVLEAEGGAQALRVAEEHSGPIHLLLTDVVMPEMSGKALAERLTARRPDMKVLYASGYTANAVVHHGVLDEGTSFLHKPFTVVALARKVRQVLDEGEEA